MYFSDPVILVDFCKFKIDVVSGQVYKGMEAGGQGAVPTIRTGDLETY